MVEFVSTTLWFGWPIEIKLAAECQGSKPELTELTELKAATPTELRERQSGH
jgi:hypothetical protein